MSKTTVIHDSIQHKNVHLPEKFFEHPLSITEMGFTSVLSIADQNPSKQRRVNNDQIL
jgi:hypothetical protein